MSTNGVNAKVLFEYVAQQDDELTIRLGDVITNVQQEDGGWWKGEVNGKSGMFPENFVSIVKSTSVVPNAFTAEVKFDYEPVQGDELLLIKGATIEVVDTPDEGWWKGRSSDGKEGLFPSNFVVVYETGKPCETMLKTGPSPDAAEADVKASQPPIGSSKIANILGMIKPEDLARKNLKKTNSIIEMKTDEPAMETSINENDGVLKPTQMVPPMHIEGEKERKKVPVVPSLPAAMTKETKQVKYAIALYDYEPDLPDELKLKVGDKIRVLDTELTFEGWMRGEVNGQVGIFPDNFVELIPTESADKPAGGPLRDIPPVPKPAKEEPSSKPMREEPVQRPKGVSMLPPGGKPLQDELAQKLLRRAPQSGEASLPSKSGNKVPPPVPGGKPGTKPKPNIPFNKPLKPTMAKPDKATVDPRPLKNDVQPDLPKAESMLPGNILRPALPKNEIKPLSDTPILQSNDFKKNMAIASRNSSVEEDDTVKTKNTKDMDPRPLPKCSSVSGERPNHPVLDMRRSMTINGKEAEGLFDKYGNRASNHDAIEKSDMDVVEHIPKSAAENIQLDDIKPTDPLKHMPRIKAPSKSPPSKYKDKHPFDAFDPVNAVDNSKEVNELKSQVAELQNKMEDMEEMFKKHFIKLTDDLSTERKLRSNQQIDIETLKQKLDILLNKPNS